MLGLLLVVLAILGFGVALGPVPRARYVPGWGWLSPWPHRSRRPRRLHDTRTQSGERLRDRPRAS
jgi:hypothetical protein